MSGGAGGLMPHLQLAGEAAWTLQPGQYTQAGRGTKDEPLVLWPHCGGECFPGLLFVYLIT